MSVNKQCHQCVTMTVELDILFLVIILRDRDKSVIK